MSGLGSGAAVRSGFKVQVSSSFADPSSLADFPNSVQSFSLGTYKEPSLVCPCHRFRKDTRAMVRSAVRSVGETIECLLFAGPQPRWKYSPAVGPYPKALGPWTNEILLPNS